MGILPNTTLLRALIVEDSKADAELLIHEMLRSGFQPDFEIVDTPAAMASALENGPWDVIISDYAMPRFSGPAALELYKKRGLDIPFIIVSGMVGESIAVEMMKAGAHDYVMKYDLIRLGPTVGREIRSAQEREKRRRAEDQVAHLAAIVEHSDDAILSKTLDGIVLSWNHAATRVYGYNAEEIVGRSVSILVPPSRSAEMSEIRERLQRGEHIQRYETSRMRKDGRSIEVSITVSPIRNGEGRVVGASTIARDITERRQRENERSQLIAELSDALADVKRLSGLLPMCAWCKKIRDDQGYWQQVEAYIREHSHADFTHGICPECLEHMSSDHRKFNPVI